MPTIPIIVVAGHACLDLIPALPADPSLRPNTLTRIGPAVVWPGGCVPNVGLALHRLGAAVRMIGKVGNDPFGRILLEQIRGYGSHLADGFTIGAGTTSYSIVVAPRGRDRLFWHCAGVNDEFVAGDVPDSALNGAGWLHFGYPPAMAAVATDGGDNVAALLQRARAKGMRTSLDFCAIDPNSEVGRIDWRAWLRRVLPHVDLAVPSFDEMTVVFGIEGDIHPSAVESIAAELLAMGCGAVAMKLGAHGLYYRDHVGHRHERCFAVEVAGATGAGDCTVAGLIAALAGGLPVDEALTIAVAVGACCCEQADATSGVPALDEVEARIAAGWPRLSASLFGFEGASTC